MVTVGYCGKLFIPYYFQDSVVFSNISLAERIIILLGFVLVENGLLQSK